MTCTCQCISCHEDAAVEIVHEERGLMVVCESHAEGHQRVIADAGQAQTSFEEFVKTTLVEQDTRIEALEEELAARNERIRELEATVAKLADRTDILQVVEQSDNPSATQRSAALLQYLQDEARDSPDGIAALSREKTEGILHSTDVDRTTYITDMKRCQKMVGDERVCWCEGRDSGPSQEARLVLDLANGTVPPEVLRPHGGR